MNRHLRPEEVEQFIDACEANDAATVSRFQPHVTTCDVCRAAIVEHRIASRRIRGAFDRRWTVSESDVQRAREQWAAAAAAKGKVRVQTRSGDLAPGRSQSIPVALAVVGAAGIVWLASTTIEGGLRQKPAAHVEDTSVEAIERIGAELPPQLRTEFFGCVYDRGSERLPCIHTFARVRRLVSRGEGGAEGTEQVVWKAIEARRAAIDSGPTAEELPD